MEQLNANEPQPEVIANVLPEVVVNVQPHLEIDDESDGGCCETEITNIPDNNIDIAIDKMDSVTIRKKKEGRGNTFISCLFSEKEITYVFNEQQEVFKKIDGLTETTYSVKFNEAFIVATDSNDELTINRVSGSATLLNDTSIPGICKLTNKTKF